MLNPYELEEREGSWMLKLNDRVTGLELGSQFVLQLHGAEEGDGRVSISIRNVFQLIQGCVVREFDPKKPAALGPALTVINKTIRWAVAFKDGRLSVEFEDGSRIASGPHREFEAWQILGPDRRSPMLIVCEIYGRLHVWPGQD